MDSGTHKAPSVTREAPLPSLRPLRRCRAASLHAGQQVVGAGQELSEIAMVAIFFPRRLAMAA